MEIRKLAIVFLLLLIAVPLVSSQGVPFTQENTEGLQIFEPRFEYAKANTNFNLHVHVNNITNGLEVNNTNSDCNVHIYNGIGSHIIELDMGKDSNGVDHELTILGGNFTEGMYTYRIYCNASTSGGATSGTFFVNNVGQELTQGNALLYGAFLILLIIGLIASLIFIPILPSENEATTGEDLEKTIKINSLKYVKHGLIAVAYSLIIAINFICYNLAYTYLYETMLETLFKSLFYISAIGGIIALPVWVAVILAHIVNDKEIKRALDRGVFA